MMVKEEMYKEIKAVKNDIMFRLADEISCHEEALYDILKEAEAKKHKKGGVWYTI